MFLKNRNISSKIKRSKVTDYAALTGILMLDDDEKEMRCFPCFFSKKEINTLSHALI